MSTPSTPGTGHCLCGNVSYTISERSYGAAVCHCEDCRRSTGAAYSLVVFVPRSSLTINGVYKEYAKPALSGQLTRRVFCPNCGSQFATFPDSNKSIATIKAGTLADDIQKTLTPKLELFTRERLPCIKDRFGAQYEANTAPPPLRSKY